MKLAGRDQRARPNGNAKFGAGRTRVSILIIRIGIPRNSHPSIAVFPRPCPTIISTATFSWCKWSKTIENHQVKMWGKAGEIPQYPGTRVHLYLQPLQVHECSYTVHGYLGEPGHTCMLAWVHVQGYPGTPGTPVPGLPRVNTGYPGYPGTRRVAP
eukprot:3076710-Rhodomonas_salina.1